jgi:hypothetical protein
VHNYCAQTSAEGKQWDLQAITASTAAFGTFWLARCPPLQATTAVIAATLFRHPHISQKTELINQGSGMSTMAGAG